MLSIYCKRDRSMNIATMFCHQIVINFSFLRHVQKWQAYFKERAGSDGALHAYLTTVGLDNPQHNRQAQPAAAGLLATWLAALRGPLLPARARLIHAIETLKQKWQMVI